LTWDGINLLISIFLQSSICRNFIFALIIDALSHLIYREQQSKNTAALLKRSVGALQVGMQSRSRWLPRLSL